MSRLSASPASALLLLPLLVALASCHRPPDPANLWVEHCARCHGSDGRGDPRRVALTSGLDLHRSEMTRQALRHRIYNAVRFGSAGMPAYDSVLEHEEIEALAAWLPSLVASPSSEPPSANPDPSSGGNR